MGVLVQGLVAHCVNEVTDWRSGTDRDPAPRVISGGSKVIASGLLGPRALVAIGVAATLAAAALGVAAAFTWGWVLALYGGLGILGAILYTLPPVRAAYRPFSGEAIAFGCAGRASSGAYVLQTGTLTGGVALAGIAHAATCVAMLMMHHYLDRVPDSRARPPKTTTIVLLGAAGRRYGVLWAAIALAAAVLLAALVDGAFAVMAVGARWRWCCTRRRPGRPRAVTRNELGVILLGMAGRPRHRGGPGARDGVGAGARRRARAAGAGAVRRRPPRPDGGALRPGARRRGGAVTVRRGSPLRAQFPRPGPAARRGRLGYHRPLPEKGTPGTRSWR